MTIKKFQGRTQEEAIAKAQEEFGPQTVIMNTKVIRPKGLSRIFRDTTYEVTAAVEDAEPSTFAKKLVPLQMPGNINVAADEPISLPNPGQDPDSGSIKEMFKTVENTWSASMPQGGVAAEERQKDNTAEANLEKKLESLQSLLEKKLESKPDAKDIVPQESPSDDSLKFVKMIYGILLENEVDEKYVNQIMDEVEKVMKGGVSVDHILSSIYQKMILKFGQPQPIELTGPKPKVVFFIGPTGVGKTTTVAKIASRFKVEKDKKVALFTADTYRIAAAEQLHTYAKILNTELTVVYSSEELNEELRKAEDYDLVLIDTAGFSHKNEEQRNEMRELIDNVPQEYDKEVYLVLSATTKYRDLLDIADIYMRNFQFKLIFTKLDETICLGNILNMKLYTGADLSYATYGQNVPEDIEVFNTQKVVKFLLGGK